MNRFWNGGPSANVVFAHHRRLIVGTICVAIVIISAWLVVSNRWGVAQAQANETIPPADVFLPIVEYRQWPALKFGADFGHMTTYPDVVEIDYPLVQEMGVDWVRVWLSWTDIETAPGEFDWSAYDPVFEQLEILGMEPLVLLFNAPPWAADLACGPITDPSALVRFTTALVTRYQDVASAWEFINEPDGFEPHPYGPVIGCWGRDAEAYATSLKLFHETVKEIDPGAMIFYGGLAYDAWDNFNRAFLAETLAHGAGDYFDGLSFHFYPINEDDFPTIRHKTDELRSIMAEQGVTGKLLWITETSMWANSDSGLDGQRNYAVQELTRAACAGVDNLFWFAIREDEAINAPLHRWLIDEEHNLVNAHDTFAHFTSRVEGGYCFGELADISPNVEAYRFDTAAGPVLVAWTDGTDESLTVTAPSPRALIDRDGNLIEVLTPVQGEVVMNLVETPRFLVVPSARAQN